MEIPKEFVLKMIFVSPSILTFFTGLYSFFYLADIFSKVLCVHLM